jgi:type IV secretion system protein VirD4
MTRPHTRAGRPAPGGSAGIEEILIAAVAGALAVAAAGQWLIGAVAALLGRGRLLPANPVQALGSLFRLPQHLTDPRQAWPAPARAALPGPILYWLATGLVLTALLTAAAVAVRLMSGGRSEPVDKRRRLGVPTQARLATSRDLRPLLTTTPEPGRLLLGRRGRRYVSTEATTAQPPGRPTGHNRAGRRGVAGAVAVFGPSQSGKTTGLIASLHAWTGPAIVSSVKADLLRATIEVRRAAGQVAVYDPLGITGQPTASWSPLRAAGTLKGALAAAQVLARAGEEGPGDRFWRGQAEQLLAGMLWTAANTPGRSMTDVVGWVLSLDRPSDASGGTLAPLVRLLTDHDDPAVAATGRQVQGWLHGQWNTDPRTTSSVYATARNAIWPWADPDIAASAQDVSITLDWLLAGNNTLYLCAPLGDETRIGVVFAAVLHDLISQAFDRYNHTGAPADPRLLVLLDEAANSPLPKLPQWASTVTGAGLQLVTVWQSRAQLDQIYGPDADNVLTNHRTKLIYPSGLSDNATLNYLAGLVGNEHVRADLDQPPWARGSEPPSRHGPATALPLLSPQVLRQMQVGDTLLIHGDLPPAWLRSQRR